MWETMHRYFCLSLQVFAIAASALGITTLTGTAQTVLPEDVVITASGEVVTPLTSEPGDPFRGLNIFIDRKLGNCVACHTNFDVASMQFLGKIGPNLDWIGDYYTEAELRGILVDPKLVLNPGTVMPAFYTTRIGYRTLEEFQGKTILTAQQVEDVVAYMASLARTDTFDGVD